MDKTSDFDSENPGSNPGEAATMTVTLVKGYGDKWDADRDLALKNYRSNGLSFTETTAKINHRFGTRYSRNAVIGRAKRLGLTESIAMLALRRAKAAVKREDHKRLQQVDPLFVPPEPSRRPPRRAPLLPQPRVAAVPRVKRSTVPTGSIASRVVHAIKASQRDTPLAPDVRPLRCVEIDPLNLSIYDLKQDTCRWPVGGWPEATPITFCGHWCPKNMPYCDVHQALNVRSVSDAPALGETA